MPILKQLIPELEGALNGKDSTLSNAAQAPVNAATARGINDVGQREGSATNPNALFGDIALQGQTQAGLASNRTIESSISHLQDILGLGQNRQAGAAANLTNAAGGKAQLGKQINDQQSQYWSQLLNAAGTVAGYATGNPGAGAAGASRSMNTGGSNPGMSGNGSGITPGNFAGPGGVSASAPLSALPPPGSYPTDTGFFYGTE